MTRRDAIRTAIARTMAARVSAGRARAGHDASLAYAVAADEAARRWEDERISRLEQQVASLKALREAERTHLHALQHEREDLRDALIDREGGDEAAAIRRRYIILPRPPA